MTRQEELEAMSEFELSITLAGLIFPINTFIERYTPKSSSIYIDTETGIERDYCNNPADIMPLVLENNINLLNQYWCDGDGVNKIAMDFTHEIESKHKNVYRAACIVLILMKE